MEKAIINQDGAYTSIITNELELKDKIANLPSNERVYFVVSAKSNAQVYYVEKKTVTVENAPKVIMTFYKDYSKYYNDAMHVPMEDYLVKSMSSNGFPVDSMPNPALNEVVSGLSEAFSMYVLNFIDAIQALSRMPY